MAESPSPGSKHGWKIATAAIIVIALLVTVRVNRVVNDNSLVPVALPTPKMPKPNGYDYLVAAGNALVDKDKIGDAVSSSAASRNGKPKPTWQEKDALVRRNAKTLSLLHQSFRYEYLNPPARSSNIPFPHYTKFRNIGRLLSLRGQVAAERGDYGGAMDSYLDSCEMGAKIPRGGMIMAMLIGVACEAIGRVPTWEIVDKVDAQSARRGARRMESILGKLTPYSDTVTEEKYLMVGTLQEVFSKPNWRREVAGLVAFGVMDDKAPPARKVSNGLKSLLRTKGQMLRSYSTHADECIALCKRPYPARKPWPDVSSDPFLGLLLPVLQKSGFKSEQNRAMDGLLCLSLGLRAHRLEHGKYPPTLQALVPGYLSALPADPFAMSGTFKYRLKADNYVLYSIGPDGKDDGGKPGVTPKYPAKYRSHYYVFRDTPGDIVAGVNKM